MKPKDQLIFEKKNQWIDVSLSDCSRNNKQNTNITKCYTSYRHKVIIREYCGHLMAINLTLKNRQILWDINDQNVHRKKQKEMNTPMSIKNLK